MIDINLLRAQPDLFREAAMRKRIDVDLDKLLELDKQRRMLLPQTEELRAKRNALSAQTHNLADLDRKQHLAACKDVANQVQHREEQLRSITEQIEVLMMLVPSLPAEDVPDGESDFDNVELHKWGAPPEFDFKTRDHLELVRMHGLAEFESVRNFAGSRAYALTGLGVLIELALMRFAIDFLANKNFVPVAPPLIVRTRAMLGTGYFPLGEENAYALQRDDGFLVGTSEVPLVAMQAERTFEEEHLPLRLAGISTCFRREAGAAGRDTRGLYRVHQFQKVEQVVMTIADEQEAHREHARLLKNSEEIMQALELPYRVVTVCTGDLGLGQTKKHDIEAWMPSRNGYGETHSCSTLNDFQSRRLDIRYRGKDGRKRYVYTLNNTAIASPRILIPLLENHQQEDGTIHIPAVLRPYLGGRERLI